MKKGILVYNPISHGGKYCHKAVDCAKRIYMEHNVELLLHAIDPMAGGFGNLTERILVEQPDHITIAGGDGTLSKYLSYSFENGISLPIGIVPAGTANDYAGAAGIESDIERALLQIFNGKPYPSDACSINSGYFLNVFSSGYLTCVSHTTPDTLKKYFGRLAYFIHGIREAISPKRQVMSISCDDESYSGKVLLVLVLNGKTAGRMFFAKEAEVTDGMIDVRIFTGKSLIGTLIAAIRVLLGANLHTTGDIICLRGEKIRIEGPAIETDIDGDSGPSYPVEIKCLSGAFQVIH